MRGRNSYLMGWMAAGTVLMATTGASAAPKAEYQDWIIKVRPQAAKAKVAPPQTVAPKPAESPYRPFLDQPAPIPHRIWPYAYSTLPLELDYDADGIPNAYDGDRDGDGIPNYRDRAPNDWGRW